MSEPTTAAGRDWTRHWLTLQSGHGVAWCDPRAAILAIEAEARAAALDEARAAVEQLDEGLDWYGSTLWALAAIDALREGK